MNPLAAHVTADAGNRIVLPKHLSDRIPWLTTGELVSAWAFLICPGRFRILSDEEVGNDPILEPIRATILNGADPPPKSDPTTAEELSRAAFVARLVPISISHPKIGWRLAVPRSFEVCLSPECDRRAFSIVFSLEGYLEIWHTGLLCTALSRKQHLRNELDKK